MTPKEKYQDIDASASVLPEKALIALKELKPVLFDKKYQAEEYAAQRKKAEEKMDILYSKIAKDYPDAIKSKVAKQPEPKTPQAMAQKAAKQTIKQPTVKNPKATAGATKRGNVTKLAKEIRKDGETWHAAMKRAGEMINKEKGKAVKKANVQYEKLKAFLAKNPTIEKTMVTYGKKPNQGTRPLDVKRDAARVAKPKGKRVSAEGKTYYEYRANRTDSSRKRYPYLELGGKLFGAGYFAKGGYFKGNEDMFLEIIEKYKTQNGYDDEPMDGDETVTMANKVAKKYGFDAKKKKLFLTFADYNQGNLDDEEVDKIESSYAKGGKITEHYRVVVVQRASKEAESFFRKHKIDYSFVHETNVGGLNVSVYDLMPTTSITHAEFNKILSNAPFSFEGIYESVNKYSYESKHAHGGEFGHTFNGAGKFEDGGMMSNKNLDFLTKLQSKDRSEVQNALKELKERNIKKGYTAKGEKYKYYNNFGLADSDFEQIVEVWHMHEKTPTVEVKKQYNMVLNAMEDRYGETKIDDVVQYIEDTHESHSEVGKLVQELGHLEAAYDAESSEDYRKDILSQIRFINHQLKQLGAEHYASGYVEFAKGGKIDVTIDEVRENGEFMDSYMIDESQTVSNAGEQESWLYKGKNYLITVWNNRAEEHYDGQEEIGIDEDYGSFAKGGKTKSKIYKVKIYSTDYHNTLIMEKTFTNEKAAVYFAYSVDDMNDDGFYYNVYGLDANGKKLIKVYGLYEHVDDDSDEVADEDYIKKHPKYKDCVSWQVDMRVGSYPTNKTIMTKTFDTLRKAVKLVDTLENEPLYSLINGEFYDEYEHDYFAKGGKTKSKTYKAEIISSGHGNKVLMSKIFTNKEDAIDFTDTAESINDDMWYFNLYGLDKDGKKIIKVYGFTEYDEDKEIELDADYVKAKPKYKDCVEWKVDMVRASYPTNKVIYSKTFDKLSKANSLVGDIGNDLLYGLINGVYFEDYDEIEKLAKGGKTNNGDNLPNTVEEYFAAMNNFSMRLGEAEANFANDNGASYQRVLAERDEFFEKVKAKWYAELNEAEGNFAKDGGKSYEAALKKLDDARLRFAKGGEITPKVNSQIVERAKIIYADNNGSTKEDFDMAYHQAIREAGYNVEEFISTMKNIGADYGHEGDDYYAKGGKVEDAYMLLYNFVDEKMIEGDEEAETMINEKGYSLTYDELYDFVDEKMIEGDSEAENILNKANRYAKGGKVKGRLSDTHKYVPNRMIQEIEVERRGKTTFIDGADILDGVYVKKGVKFAHGGSMPHVHSKKHRNG